MRKKVGRKAGRVGRAEREGPAGHLVMTQKGVCAAALPGGQHESWACLGKVLVAIKFWLGPKARRLFVTISAFVQLPQVAFESPRFDCLLD